MAQDELTRLYKLYGPVIYARCRHLLGDDAEAEDATQETFVRAFKHLARIPPSREALFWIHRVATNYCLNELRDRSHRPAPIGTVAEETLAAPDERLGDRHLAAQLVGRAQARLKPVAWLYHVDGFDQEEVARILGLSRRTVATRLARFLENARKLVRWGDS
jgi:RNA polymerase sigma-70 factor (ECF subfamily)